MVKTKLKATLKIFTVSLLLCSGAHRRALYAQEQYRSESNQAKAVLFYSSNPEYGPRWDLSEEPGVFRYVEQERPARPHDKVVYIAYGPLGEATAYLLSIDNWLKQVIGVDPKLIFTFDGGREKKLRYEVWLVPEGAEIPKINKLVADEETIFEFAHYPYEDQCEVCGIQGRYALEALVKILKQRPQSKAYLDFYGCGGRRANQSRVVRHEIMEAKQILVKEGGITPSRILIRLKAVGKRDCQTRIWLLPSRSNSSAKENNKILR